MPVLIGEAASMGILESVQQREEHWVVADLVGKGGHVRTVPIPSWFKAAVDAWTTAASITEGRVFRAINKPGRSGATACHQKCCEMSSEWRQHARASRSWHRTICAERARGYATWRVADSSRSSSS
jgi:hypothetical protein